MSRDSISASHVTARAMRFALLGVGLALSGCVLSPEWGDAPLTRSTPIDFLGMAAAPSMPVFIQARHPGTGAWANIRALTSTTSRITTEPPHLYGWTTQDVIIPSQYWSGPCAGGSATLQVLEYDTQGRASVLSTFDEAGTQCRDDLVGAGEHPANAGAACRHPDSNIVLFAQRC